MKTSQNQWLVVIHGLIFATIFLSFAIADLTTFRGHADVTFCGGMFLAAMMLAVLDQIIGFRWINFIIAIAIASVLAWFGHCTAGLSPLGIGFAFGIMIVIYFVIAEYLERKSRRGAHA